MYSKEKAEKRLVVNADDFGLDSAVNLGIIEAFENGIVNNTSLLVCGRAFEEAVELARKNKGLSVGIHLTLNEEKAILPRDTIGTLIDEKNSLLFGYGAFLGRFLFGRIVFKQIYSELEAQVEKFMKTGLSPTHLDSHKHVHIIPQIFEMLLELAKRFGIKGIRLPRSAYIDTLRSEKCFRAMGVMGLSTLANMQAGKLRRLKLNTTDYCCGLVESGHLSEDRLIRILERLPIGVNELICHPGLESESLSRRYKWNYDWPAELKALTSRRAIKLIKELNINLIKYDEIEY